MVIILLYILNTINSAADWTFLHFLFVENGKSCWTVYLKLTMQTQAVFLVSGIASTMSTIITDLYMVHVT